VRVGAEALLLGSEAQVQVAGRYQRGDSAATGEERSAEPTHRKGPLVCCETWNRMGLRL
jgi:hypothetical protein